ncbi:MAG: substrate-binding domain-containing protein [Omnitrophica WOR_2 bacterium]
MPTLAPVHVGLPVELQPATGAIQACARTDPQIPLFIDEVTGNSTEQKGIDFSISLGEPANLPPFTALLAREEILVIVQPDVAISHLSSEQLAAIFTGKITSWKQFGGADHPVLVWVYPDGNTIRHIFDAVLNISPATSLAMVAPDPRAMLEGVGKQPGSIGYLPNAWLTPDVKNIQIDAGFRLAMLQPVLAMANQNPQGAARRLIGCLQTGSGRQILLKYYQP